MIKEYAREILKALVFLESHKIIHCDLKPENILLDEGATSIFGSSTNKCKLKLVDFGSGSFRGEQVYTYVQSRFYRAPEVMFGSTTFGVEIDAWSVGIIAAELAGYAFTNEKVTTVASVSSILGGASGTTITYTDGTDSVAQSVVSSELTR